jgi:hypothetical protein
MMQPFKKGTAPSCWPRSLVTILGGALPRQSLRTLTGKKIWVGERMQFASPRLTIHFAAGDHFRTSTLTLEWPARICQSRLGYSAQTVTSGHLRPNRWQNEPEIRYGLPSATHLNRALLPALELWKVDLGKHGWPWLRRRCG